MDPKYIECMNLLPGDKKCSRMGYKEFMVSSNVGGITTVFCKKCYDGVKDTIEQ